MIVLSGSLSGTCQLCGIATGLNTNGIKKVFSRMVAKKLKENNRKPYVPADKAYGKHHKSGVGEFALLCDFKRKYALTNHELSRLLGVSIATVNAWTSGRHIPHRPALRIIRLVEYLLAADTGHTPHTLMQMLF
jgi:DNA-binding transcriptional regulator YiaG